MRTTGDYVGLTLEEACARLPERADIAGTDYDRDTKSCQLMMVPPPGTNDKWVLGNSLDAWDTCAEAALLPSTPDGIRYRRIGDHRHRCEDGSTVHDTVVMAMNAWTKRPTISVQRTCRWRYDWRTRRYRRVCYNGLVYTQRELELAAEDDDGGLRGAWSELRLPADNQSSYAALLVGLHPWNETYFTDNKTVQQFGVGTEALSSVRVYRDRINDALGNADSDGDLLSDSLENVLGTNARDVDSDSDGIIDGLEIYGGAGLPLPVLGGDPLEKNLVIEVDRLNGQVLRVVDERSVESAGHAFEDAGWHLISLTGDSNNNLTPNQTPVMAVDRIPNHGTTGTPSEADGLVTISNPDATQNADFDLSGYLCPRAVLTAYFEIRRLVQRWGI